MSGLVCWMEWMGCGLLAVNQEMENRNDGLRRHSRNIKRFTVPSTAKVSAKLMLDLSC